MAADQDEYDPLDACQDDSSVGVFVRRLLAVEQIQSSAGDADEHDGRAPGKRKLVKRWLNDLGAPSSNRSLGWGKGRLTRPQESAEGGCSGDEAEMESRDDKEERASTREWVMAPEQGMTSYDMNGMQEEKDDGSNWGKRDGYQDERHHHHHQYNEGHQYYSNGSWGRRDANRRRGFYEEHRRDRRREDQEQWGAMQDTYFQQQSRELRQSRSRSRDRFPCHRDVSRDGDNRSRSRDWHERRDRSWPVYEDTSRRERYRSRGEEDYWERRYHGGSYDSWDGSSSSRYHPAPVQRGRGPSSSVRDDHQRVPSKNEDRWDSDSDVPHHEAGEKGGYAVEQDFTETSIRSESQGKAFRRSRSREKRERRDLRPCKRCRLVGQSDNPKVSIAMLPPTLLLPPPPSPEDVEAVRKYFENLRKCGLISGVPEGSSQAECENGDKKAKKRKKAVDKDRARRPPPAYAGSSTTSSSPTKRKNKSASTSPGKGKNNSSSSSPVKGKNNSSSQPIDLKSLSRAQKKFYKDISSFVKKVLQTYLHMEKISSIEDMDFLAKKMTYKIYAKEHGNTEMSVETPKKITKYIKVFFEKQPFYRRKKGGNGLLERNSAGVTLDENVTLNTSEVLLSPVELNDDQEGGAKEEVDVEEEDGAGGVTAGVSHDDELDALERALDEME